MTSSRSPEQIYHEEQLILAFVLPARRRRYIEKLGSAQRRKEITETLAHFSHVDPRYATPPPAPKSNAEGILALLKSKGAPDFCWVISEGKDLDGKRMPLSEALANIVGHGIGTFLSCIPGTLAYFEDEDGRSILHRTQRSTPAGTRR